MLRSSKAHYKSSELYPILNMHFGKSMNLARIKAMSLMICALCKVQRVAYTKLASAFDTDATAGSSLRRIQRLIAECVIDTDLIAKLILKLIPVKGPYNLAMDRTNWKYGNTNINILTLGVIYDGMAFPVVYTMMEKRGNSNTLERIELVNRFKRIAGKDSIAHLMADREFVGEEWLDRMSNLFAIIMVAYIWCYLVGIYIHENIKQIKVLKHGRRAVSLFKYGLDYICQCLVNHTNRYRINVFKFLSYT
jgi:hypothetical protein